MIKPVPETNVQLPVPTAAVLPAIVATVAQTVWLAPAFAVVGTASACIKTVDVDGGQTPLLIVHWKIFVPVPRAESPDVGDVVAKILPAPNTNVQLPVPIAGTFPANVAELAQTDWLGPALDTVGAKNRVIATVELEDGQTPFPTVHIKIFAPAPNAVRPDVGELILEINPDPDTKVHVPVPMAGIFPLKVAVVAHTLCEAPALDTVGLASC